MRIHLVSEHASPLALLGGVDAGGQNVHVAALATALAAGGDDVVVHTRRDDPALPRRVRFAPGVVVDHVDAGPPEPLAKDDLLQYMGEFAQDLRRCWAVERPDVVHAHFWMSGLAALDAGRAAGVPVALTYHALGAEKRRHQGAVDTSPEGRIRMERWLAVSVDRVIATTAAECRTLVDDGAPARRISVIPCGVDLDRFTPEGPTFPAVRSTAAGVRHRVVCVSRLVPRKGIEDVVTAVAGLPHVELLVAGGPPAAMLCEDGYARTLVGRARELGAADRIHLLGAVDHHRIPALLRSADIACCTPWYEPFGLVAVEAMACGTPVVATAVGGLAETVDDGRTGILVPPQRPASIRAAIAAIVDHPRRGDSMHLASLARAQRYGWPAIARRTREVLADLVATAEGSTDAALVPPAAVGGGA